MIKHRVTPIEYRIARSFIEQHHYCRGMGNSAVATFGLFANGALVGACAFAVPCSENVCASVFGKEHCRRVVELHRVVVLDGAPPVNAAKLSEHCENTESWFVSRAVAALKEQRPDHWAVVSFADPTAGHVGTIYQATNGYYYGQSDPRTFFLDETGRLRHPKQCNAWITREEAERRGWTPVKRAGKHRYCFFLPDDRRHARRLHDMLRLKRVVPYPKIGFTASGQLEMALNTV